MCVTHAQCRVQEGVSDVRVSTGHRDGHSYRLDYAAKAPRRMRHRRRRRARLKCWVGGGGCSGGSNGGCVL